MRCWFFVRGAPKPVLIGHLVYRSGQSKTDNEENQRTDISRQKNIKITRTCPFALTKWRNVYSALLHEFIHVMESLFWCFIQENTLRNLQRRDHGANRGS